MKLDWRPEIKRSLVRSLSSQQLRVCTGRYLWYRRILNSRDMIDNLNNYCRDRKIHKEDNKIVCISLNINRFKKEKW